MDYLEHPYSPIRLIKHWTHCRLSIFMAFCLFLSSCALADGVRATAPSPRIILLETFDVPIILEHSHSFLKTMKELGYSSDNIITIKAQGDPDRAKRLLQNEINKKKPDLVVANATLAAQIAFTVSKIHKIPMIFFVVSDPVGAGILAKLDVPSNELVAGVVHSVPRDTKIEMVMRVLEPLKPKNRPFRFGYIHSTYPSAVGDLRMLKEAAKKRGDLEFISFEIPYDEKHFNIRQTMAQLVKGVNKLDPKIDYWWISQDPVGELDEFVKTLSRHSVHPIVCGTNAGSTKWGALVHITADTEAGARDTALMADAILKGAVVGSIPVHSASKIDFGVNLSTAVRMGIAIPSDLLQLAGPNIFR